MAHPSLLFFTIFARAFGFFSLSPLFKWQKFPAFLRLTLALTTALLIVPSFFSQKITLPPPLFLVNLIKEVALGYLLGFLFSLLFEGAALAGEFIGSMMGFSLTELFDPLENTSTPFMSKLFTLVVGVLFFALDLHHTVIKTLFESFSILPISHNILSHNVIQIFIEQSSFFFKKALEFAAIPLFFLFPTLALLAIFSRLFPEFPIFWLGFPLQLLIGMFALFIAFSSFSEIINEGILKLIDFSYRMLYAIK